jgi:hypothetical protein
VRAKIVPEGTLPSTHIGMYGVEDSVYPCLESRQMRLNIISTDAHFLASGLIDSIWLPLKVVRRGAIIITNIE